MYDENFSMMQEDLGISETDADAIQMFELFKSLQKAGFNERQALILISLIGLPDPTLVVLDDDDNDVE